MAALLPVLGEEDAAPSQILEIIGGITPEALQSLGEPCNETDAWSMEEGDDSVFYSDEETPQVAISKTRRRVNSEADEMPLQEDKEEEMITETVHFIAQEEEKRDTEEQELENTNPSTAISEMFVSAHDDVGQMMHTDSAAQSSSKDLTDFSSSKEPASSNPLPGTSPPSLEVYRKPEKIQSQLQHGRQDPSEGPCLPALSKKKSSHPKSFNHLTSSKYSTLSYRKIRRGNTRQKIEEFEYMIMKL